METIGAARTDALKSTYKLERHPEGGWFAEVYTSPSENGERPGAGSIYYLLDAGEVSHFHMIDCDEIWYYHEGCGMKITLLTGNGKEEMLLGCNLENNEQAMAIIKRGTIFAAENLVADGYTFVSCVTVPKFKNDGFRLAERDEIESRYPDLYDEISHLVY